MLRIAASLATRALIAWAAMPLATHAQAATSERPDIACANEARVRRSAKHAHPRYWAAFVQYGAD